MAESKILKQVGFDFETLRLTNQSTTANVAKTLKTYDRKVYGVMRGYVAGSASYDREGVFNVENDNSVTYFPKVTQNSVTLECVVVLAKS